ncbi:hypothetical protein DACRYDRAFT_24441 [Dacryopinax primogenitus]|uniref:Uncharacterized protein n=1 Tax=Dacryopinax primogenitus (strain DJM 731) TaxID=1858805 RepID=M5FPA6_DACPD|nr:uncharacterized protein DACRYDRAFT_24441 [Dacryopinax primogenitus]EJT98380.1 hypothetical protein DACRYDRAFT_24441 [Dacryopinax primogenitus]
MYATRILLPATARLQRAAGPVIRLSTSASPNSPNASPNSSNSSGSSSPVESPRAPPSTPAPNPTQSQTEQTQKTLAGLDEELRVKLEERSGEGGLAGLELEGGAVPEGMRRGMRAGIRH